MQNGHYQEAATVYLEMLTLLDNLPAVEPRRRTPRSMANAASRNYNLPCVSDDEDDQEEDDPEDQTFATELVLLAVPINANLEVPPLGLETINTPTSFLLYHQMFVTTSREQTQVTLDASNRALTKAFVYFNLGVCLQFKEGTGQVGSELGSNMLRRAKTLYMNALRALDQFQPDGVREDAFFLTLGLYNNLGRVYQKLDQTQGAARCSSQIQVILRQHLDAQVHMNARDWSFFAYTAVKRQQAQESGPSIVQSN